MSVPISVVYGGPKLILMFITSVAGNYKEKGTWTGLNDISTEGQFTWSDGSAVSFSNWLSGQPDKAHKLEDCVKIVGSKWNDVSCGTQLKFVCKIP